LQRKQPNKNKKTLKKKQNKKEINQFACLFFPKQTSRKKTTNLFTNVIKTLNWLLLKSNMNEN